MAVKLLDDKVKDERTRVRFQRECLALGRLSGHPNIITVFGAGFSTKDRPYLLMEYMSQGSLADRRAAEGRMSWQDTVGYMIKIAGALETAHRAGILHRDIKPENILLSTYGEPMLADFGIARLQDAPATQTTAITTSVAHAAPEIFEGKQPAVSWDVYALGSTMFTVLAGRYAFVHDSDDSLLPALSRIATEPVPDLRDEGVPSEVCEIIEEAMAKASDDRYPSALEMGRAMQRSQKDLGVPLTPITVDGEPPLPAPPVAKPSWASVTPGGSIDSRATAVVAPLPDPVASSPVLPQVSQPFPAPAQAPVPVQPFPSAPLGPPGAATSSPFPAATPTGTPAAGSSNGALKAVLGVLIVVLLLLLVVALDALTVSGLAVALVGLGSTLGLRTVAEGIEDREQLDALRGAGCELGQGFLFSKPLPPGRLEALFLSAGPSPAYASA